MLGWTEALQSRPFSVAIRENTYFSPPPTSSSLLSQGKLFSKQQMSCCRNVTSFRSVFAIGYRWKNVGSFRKYLARMWKTSITFAEMYAIFFSQFMNQH